MLWTTKQQFSVPDVNKWSCRQRSQLPLTLPLKEIFLGAARVLGHLLRSTAHLLSCHVAFKAARAGNRLGLGIGLRTHDVGVEVLLSSLPVAD